MADPQDSYNSRPGQTALGMAGKNAFSHGTSVTGTVNATTGAWAKIDTGLDSVEDVILTAKNTGGDTEHAAGTAKYVVIVHLVTLHWVKADTPGYIFVYSYSADPSDADAAPEASVNFSFLAFGKAKMETGEIAWALDSQSAA